MLGAAEWGTVPDWIGAIGTAGALVAAVVVFSIELRHRREERKDAEKDQARLVAAWVTGPAGTSTLTSHQSSMEYPVRIVNRSELPVYSCLVRLEWPGAPAGHHILGTLAPGHDGTTQCGVPWSAVSVEVGTPTLSLGFTDAAGRPWRQYGAGKLEPGYWPPPAATEG